MPDHPLVGQSFYSWSGYSVSSSYSADTTLIMPAGNATVTVTFNTASGNQPDYTITNGLVAWYQFDEGSGTNIADSSGIGKQWLSGGFAQAGLDCRQIWQRVSV